MDTLLILMHVARKIFMRRLTPGMTWGSVAEPISDLACNGCHFGGNPRYLLLDCLIWVSLEEGFTHIHGPSWTGPKNIAVGWFRDPGALWCNVYLFEENLKVFFHGYIRIWVSQDNHGSVKYLATWYLLTTINASKAIIVNHPQIYNAWVV